jgi:hypothetical protein
MIKPMCVGALLGAIVMGLVVVWANETNIGLQLKALDCVPSTGLGGDVYLCFVGGM